MLFLPSLTQGCEKDIKKRFGHWPEHILNEKWVVNNLSLLTELAVSFWVSHSGQKSQILGLENHIGCSTWALRPVKATLTSHGSSALKSKKTSKQLHATWNDSVSKAEASEGKRGWENVPAGVLHYRWGQSIGNEVMLPLVASGFSPVRRHPQLQAFFPSIHHFPCM